MKPVGSKTIRTDRLLLRAPAKEDTAALVQIHSLTGPMENAVRSMNGIIEECRKPFVFHWVITRQGTVIGRIKAWDVNPYNGYLQLGYDIGEQYRNCGYMTEAVKAVIEFLMTQAEVNRVFCSVRERNIASKKVCEKCGMQQEGILRQHYARQDGGYDDVHIYGIVKRDTGREN